MKLSTSAITSTLIVLSLSTTGCYVVPLHDTRPTTYPHTQPTPVPLPAASVTRLSARLYPTNYAATSLGAATGVVTSYATGRGEFSIVLGGENYVGEATRVGNYGAKGIASAVGSRGNALRCEYSMSSNQFGSGKCTLTGGAEYDVHFSN